VRALAAHGQRWCVVAVLVGACLAPAALRGQGDGPGGPFRSGVELVPISVVVLDAQRQPVTGLSADDFLVRDEGESRPIQAFVPIVLPTRGETTPFPTIAPDVISNQIADTGRLVVILMDASTPAGELQVTARSIARSIVAGLGPGDFGAVVRSSPFDDDGASQAFTSDPRRLVEAIDSPVTGATSAPPGGAGDMAGDGAGGLDKSIACRCGLCQWETLLRIANALAATATRQKMLFFVGRDLRVQDTPQGRQSPCALAIRTARDRATRALDRANITVYSVDPSGLETLAPAASSKRAGMSAAGNLQRQGNLKVLPDLTGGRAILNTNEFASKVAEIFDETHAYYLLGIAPAKASRERPGVHHIEVRVRGRDDLIIRARSGYFPQRMSEPAPAISSDPLARLIAPLLPVSDLPLSLEVTSTFLATSRPAINILLGFSGTDHPPVTRTYDLLVSVFDAVARPVGTTRQTVLARADANDDMLTWRAHVPAPPGSYEVRIAATDQQDGAGGSVYGYVTVPDPEAYPLAIGDLRLATITAGTVSSTLRRSFARGVQLAGLLELHRRKPTTPIPSLRVTLQTSSARVVSDALVPATNITFHAVGVAELRLPLATTSLGPGDYVLRVALEGMTEPQPRELSFRVR
jgi:VWFA-related protein